MGSSLQFSYSCTVIQENEVNFTMKHFLAFALIFIVCTGNLVAQDTIQKKIQIRKNTLKDQMAEAFDESNSYQEYKVIKKTQLATLRRNILDSVTALEKGFDLNEKQFSEQGALIDSLKTELKNTKQMLANSKEKEEGISVLGINTHKSTYNVLMWSLILILLVGASFLFYKYLNTNKITKTAELKLAETEIELEEQKQNSLEREQVLRRKLQDEINKNR